MTIRLAQIFDVFGTYLPKKVSLYLKRTGINPFKAFQLTETVVVDATNFSSIEQKDHKILFDDSNDSFTGTGYLRTIAVDGDAWSRVHYPIQTNVGRLVYLYLRVRTPSGDFNGRLFLDGRFIKNISFTSLGTAYAWVSTSIILPDTNIHDFAISMEGDGLELDKLYFSKDQDSPSHNGPEISPSPFVTIHLQVFNTENNEPTTALAIYDTKTTLDEIANDDWYNFDVSFLDGSTSFGFEGRFALVVSSTGSTAENYVIWELVDNDEYLLLPSALKVRDV